MTEDIIATRREEMAQKRKVKKNILQIILNAHNENPELYMEPRVRDEMHMFIYGALIPRLAILALQGG
jgi:predicted DNA-binding protein (UPF0278 family)